jgi:hypothetical protein
MYQKAFLLLACSLAVLTWVDTASARLVAQYTFEGNVNDVSGQGHDGVAHNGPTYVPGKFGKAMHFDGVDDYVDIDPFKYTNDEGEFGLTFWFKVKSIPNTATNQSFPYMFNHGMTNRNNNISIYFRSVEFDQRTHTRLMDLANPEDIRAGGGPVWITDLPAADMVDGQWHMYAITSSSVDGGTIYIDGKVMSSSPSYRSDMVNLVDKINLGRRGFEGEASRYFGSSDPEDGLMDDVRIYNHALTAEEVTLVMTGANLAFPQAWNPVPNGREFVSEHVILSWSPGEESGNVKPRSNDVYLGTSFDDVTTATGSESPGVRYFHSDVNSIDLADPLVPGTTYYWRVDAIYDVNTYKGEIWSFTVHPSAAFNPNPSDGTVDVPVDATLSWTAGQLEAAPPMQHELYMGTRFNEVEQASRDDHTGVEFNGLDTDQFQPGALGLGTTYYWRVDERYAGATVKGPIWTFTTIPFVVVEDFEDYNDFKPYRVFDTWSDGWEIDDNGSTVGYPDPDFERDEHFVEVKIVHGGKQAMPLAYDNSDTARYSKASADLSALGVTGDWAKTGAKALVLYFYGDADNQIRATERMEIALEDIAGHVATVPYDGSMSDLQKEAWTEWNIELSKFSDDGVDLSNVAKITIGIGDPKGTVRGGTGMIYVDDIRLYVSRCLAKYQPAADLNGDCKVDYRDLQVMADDWLAADRTSAGVKAEYLFEGNTEDTSGNGHHGTAFGDPTYVTFDFGQALSFDGVDDYVEIPPFKYTNDLGEFTISFWFKVHDVNATATNNGFPYLFNHGMTNRSNNVCVYFLSADGTLRTHTRLMNPANPEDVRGQGGPLFTYDIPGLADGQWYFYTLTSSANAGGIIYIDGQARGTNASYKGDMVNLTDTINLGRRGFVGESTRFFGSSDENNGLIDDVRIYDRPLSLDEIATVMAGKGLDTTAYYPIVSPANLYDKEPTLSKRINFKDFAVLAQQWLRLQLWP